MTLLKQDFLRFAFFCILGIAFFTSVTSLTSVQKEAQASEFQIIQENPESVFYFRRMPRPFQSFPSSYQFELKKFFRQFKYQHKNIPIGFKSDFNQVIRSYTHFQAFANIKLPILMPVPSLNVESSLSKTIELETFPPLTEAPLETHDAILSISFSVLPFFIQDDSDESIRNSPEIISVEIPMKFTVGNQEALFQGEQVILEATASGEESFIQALSQVEGKRFSGIPKITGHFVESFEIMKSDSRPSHLILLAQRGTYILRLPKTRAVFKFEY